MKKLVENKETKEISVAEIHEEIGRVTIGAETMLSKLMTLGGFNNSYTILGDIESDPV